MKNEKNCLTVKTDIFIHPAFFLLASGWSFKIHTPFLSLGEKKIIVDVEGAGEKISEHEEVQRGEQEYRQEDKEEQDQDDDKKEQENEEKILERAEGKGKINIEKQKKNLNEKLGRT